MVTRDVLKVFQIAIAYGSCNLSPPWIPCRLPDSVNVLTCDWFKLRFQGSELGSLRTYASNFAKLQNSSFMNYGKHSPLFLSFVHLQDLYSKPFSKLYLCDLFNVKYSLTGMLRDR